MNVYKSLFQVLSSMLCCLLLVQISFAQGIRKHYEEMTNSERDAVIAAYWAAGGSNGNSGLNSDIANFHATNFNDIHFNDPPDDVFFAWHRQASYELERAMKDGENNEWITIPYWDWTKSNSKSDDLWQSNWLQPFNGSWDLNRSSSSSQSLPTQANINVALAESDFFQFSRFEVEQNPIHSRGHTWTGGVMTQANSPKDPTFFFHHNMVDKIWADWYEIHGTAGANYYAQTNMPRYPNIDPDDIVDPRSLGLFYAEDELVTLDKYSVKNTDTNSEKFGYQYTIEAKDNFIVPNGRNAEFKSCELIRLRPGFRASNGSTFLARIESNCNSSTAIINDNEPLSFDKKDEFTGLDVSIYPNPVYENFTIELTSNIKEDAIMKLYTVTGKQVKQVEIPNFSAGTNKIQLDVSDLENGIYFCNVTVGSTSKTVKVIKE